MMTPYGPGKFTFEADRVVYQKSLEGAEMEYYSPYFGWFGVVLGPLAPDWEGATDEDKGIPRFARFPHCRGRAGASSTSARSTESIRPTWPSMNGSLRWTRRRGLWRRMNPS